MGGGGSGEGGKNGNREGRLTGEPGAEKRTTVTVAMTETTAQASGRLGQHDQVSSKRTGGGYRVRRGAEGESANESAGWTVMDSDGAATTEGAGWAGEPRTLTAGGTQESGADGRSGDAMARRGNTQKASSAFDDVGVGGRHVARLV